MRSLMRTNPLIAGLVVLVAALGVTGCGGGGGAGGGGGGVVTAPAIVDTSFQGFPSAPGGTIPPIFRDEVLQFTLDQALDTTQFGGLVTSGGGTPLVFTGFSSTSALGVQYNAFANQTAANLALQVLENIMGGAQHLGVIGIRADNPNVLVFDPAVPFGNQFGLPGIQGLMANTQFTIFLPGPILGSSGLPLPVFGAPPVVMTPPFNPSPPPSSVCLTGAGFAPDTIPPNVIDISSMALNNSGGNPAVDPIPHDDTIIVTFSEPIDLATLNLQANLIVRNTSVTNSASADIGGGVLVPVTQTADSTGRTIFVTPNPSFGNGPFTISIEVGTNASSLDDIRDLPAGVDGSQRGLANSMIATFTTAVTTGQQTSASIPEDFEDTDQMDATFTPRFNAAQWNEAFGAMGLPSGQLRGVPINGVATMGAGGLGTGAGRRTQATITPQGVANAAGPCPQTVCSYFSPFDDNGTNNLGVNPNGGSHTQLLYMQGTAAGGLELPNGLASAIELYEWNSPPSTGAFLFTFNSFTMRMGHTTADASTASTPEQLTVIYDRNFTFTNPQNEAFIKPTSHPDPMNTVPNDSPVTVVPTSPYFVGEFSIAPGFIPYPLLTLPFDFDGNRTEPNINAVQVNPNLVVDINIDAPVMPNFNFSRGTNVNSAIPFRRLIGGPGAASSFALDAVVHQGRFTFVEKNSSARTLFYDVGQGTTPTYVGIDFSPAIDQRPAGTFIRVRVLGSTSASGGTNNPGGNQEYVARDGMIDSTALMPLNGFQFIRLVIDMEANPVTNVEPFLEGFLIGYTF